MRKEINNFWLTSIRSWTHVQGTGFLRSNDDKHCILGVLADLAVVYKKVVRTQDKESYLYDGNRFMLPANVLLWSGIKNPHGYSTHIGKSLTDLNDSGKSWTDLADLIEKHWENL